MLKLIVLLIYTIGLYLCWDIVKTNYEEEKFVAQNRGVEFKFNWPKEILIGLVIWIFSPVWMIGFLVLMIKPRLFTKKK